MSFRRRASLLHFLPPLVFGACGPREVITTDIRCDEVGTPLSQTSWAGPTEAEVLAAAAAATPTEITWDPELTRADPNAVSSPVTVEAVRTDAEASVVTFGECNMGPYLKVPMSFRIDIDGGDAVAYVLGGLYGQLPEDGSEEAPIDTGARRAADAGGDALPPVLVWMDGTALLSPTWDSLVRTYMATSHPLEAIVSYRLTMGYQPWTAGLVGVDFVSDIGGEGILWAGTWTTTDQPQPQP